MDEIIKKLVDDADYQIKPLADNLIELSDYILSEKPDVCLFPMRGAYPILNFLSYIYAKKGIISPRFEKVYFCVDTIENNLTHSHLPNEDFPAAMILDEVGTGWAWAILFNIYENYYMKFLKQKTSAEKVVLSGLSIEAGDKGRKELFDKVLTTPHKLYYEYDCKIVRLLMDKLGFLHANKYSDTVKDFTIKIQNLAKNINDESSYEKNLDNIISCMAEYCETIEAKALNDSNYKSLSDTLDELLGTSSDKILSDKIGELKKRRGELFGVKKTKDSLTVKVFNSPHVCFCDEPELLGIDKSWDEKGKPYYFDYLTHNTLEFNALVELYIDKGLRLFDKNEWLERISELEDEDFEKGVKKLL